MREKIPWYLVKHSGSKLQGIWQLAVGGSLLVGLVIAPLVSTLYTNSRYKAELGGQYPFNPTNSGHNDKLQALVYKERLRMRAALLKEEK